MLFNILLEVHLRMSELRRSVKVHQIYNAVKNNKCDNHKTTNLSIQSDLL